jgi:hypothetical protein
VRLCYTQLYEKNLRRETKTRIARDGTDKFFADSFSSAGARFLVVFDLWNRMFIELAAVGVTIPVDKKNWLAGDVATEGWEQIPAK